MAHFSYKGRNARGEAVEGALDAESAGACADELYKEGVIPLEINAASAGSKKSWLKFFAREKAGPVELMLFSRQMHTLLKAGVPILSALSGLQESMHNKAFAEGIAVVRENLDSGRELSVSLSRQPQIFSPFYVNMVRVGETTGMLDEVFLRLYHYLEFEHRSREQVRSALRYPAFVIAALLVALVVVNLFVIPVFSKVYSGFHVGLPSITRLLIHFSDFWVRFWPLMLGGAVACVYAVRFYVGTTRGRYQWDKFKLGLPVVGEIIRKVTLARFARSFSLASQSGVPIVLGFSVVAQVVENAYFAERIEGMRSGVERGESILRTAINAGIFNPVVLQMIAVGEETGEIDDMMREVAEMYEREVEYDVANLGAKIEPILIVGLGILVLILALGVYLPLWDLGHAALHPKG